MNGQAAVSRVRPPVPAAHLRKDTWWALPAVTALVPDPWQVAFTASADHDSLVTSYLLEIFVAGADPSTATAVATSA